MTFEDAIRLHPKFSGELKLKLERQVDFSQPFFTLKGQSMKSLAPRTKNFGFSMVEILVAIAIVVLLAVLLVPFGKKMLKSTQSAQCMSNLRQIYLASMVYAQDHHMEVPCSYLNINTGQAWHMVLAGESGGGMPGKDDVYLPLEYAVRPNVLFCPSNPSIKQTGSNWNPGMGSWGWTNYAINGHLYTGKYVPIRLTSLSSPVVFYLDSFDGDDGTVFEIIRGNSHPFSAVHAVHGDRIHVIFTDGHIKTPKVFPRIIDPMTKDLNELKSSWFVTQ